MKVLLMFFVLASSLVANAANVTINPGDSITVRQQTTVYCSDSGSSYQPTQPTQKTCQAGPFTCVGQVPGALCGIDNGVKSYCIQVAVYPHGNIGCSCDN